MTIRHTEQAETILSGTVFDQAVLYGLLAKLQSVLLHNLRRPLPSKSDQDLDLNNASLVKPLA